jgi:hypothetical protein
MRGQRTPFVAGVSALALLAGSGAAIAATHSGSHHAKPTIQHATNQGTTTTTTTTTPAPGSAASGHDCPDGALGSGSSSGSSSSTSF